MSYHRHRVGDRLKLFKSEIYGTVIWSDFTQVTIERDDGGEYTPKYLTGFNWEFHKIGELL